MLSSLVSHRGAMLAVGVIFLSRPCRDNSFAEDHAAVPPAAEQSHDNGDPVLVGAGDIASCESSGDERTARLLDDIPGTVFTAGDNAYLSGEMRNPFQCYDASWGRHKSRTRPVPGNHEYEGRYVDGYFEYFGARAGERGKGYYSYDLGAWHIVALNSMIEAKPSSPQGQWLSRDLARNRHLCTLAYLHHPRFSSGPHHTSRRAIDLWNALANAGVDVVVAGHDHIYERFAPMTANGDLNDAGTREFVVGTGGASHYRIYGIARNSEVRNNNAYGVIKFTLHDSGYDWKFVPVRGGQFSDAGTDKCH